MKHAVSACVLALLLNACSLMEGTPPQKPGSVDHVVLFWLNRSGNQQDRKKLHAAEQQLRTIPGVVSIRHGSPLASERPIVDDSFDVAYIITFDSVSSLRAYDIHPTHTQLVSRLVKPLCRKVLVYDVIH